MLEMENRKDAIITKLTEKENEQSNIIHLLQKNLELRTQVDEDVCTLLIFLFQTSRVSDFPSI